MNLYIVRHAHAENGAPDSERQLSQRGREFMKEQIPKWKRSISNVDLILSSPYKRALETAEYIHKGFDVKHELIIEQSLQPIVNIPNFIITLSSFSVKNILVVGHMPDVAELTSLLISSNNIELLFTPGTIAALEFKENISLYRGKLRFILNN